MKIDKYEKIKESMYRLYLDNGEVIDTYDDVILDNDLLLKKEITPSIYNSIMYENRIQELCNSCIKYISYRLRSTKEIRDYLKKKDASSEEIEVVINILNKKKVLNDELFCECFIKDKMRFTSMGKYRIIKELQSHNISNDIIDKYISLMDDGAVIEKIEKLVDKKIRSNHKLDNYKLRDKIYYNLINLGYPSDLVVKVLNNKF